MLALLISAALITIKATTHQKDTDRKKWTTKMYFIYFKSNPIQLGNRIRMIEIWAQSVRFNTTKQA